MEKLVPKLRFPEFDGNWEKKIIKDISNKITDGTHDTPKPIEKGIPFLTAIHVRDGFIDYDNCYYLPQEEHNKIYERCNPEKGDLLMVNIGAGTATSALVNVDFEFSLKNVALIKPNNELIESSFFEQIQRKNSLRLKHQLSSGGAQPFLSLKEIAKLKLSIPLLPEQQKIATFLTSVDERIALLEKQKQGLETYKKGVMQQLFSQQLRFKDDSGNDFPDWEEKKLGELLKHLSLRNKKIEIENVLSVSNTKGFISQNEQFENHRVASKDVSNYKIVKKNQFAYNPSRINVGSIAKLKNFEIGIVSPMYVVFETSKKLDHTFFESLIDLHYFKFLVKKGCSGSVRDSLNFEDLEQFNFKIPSIKEQQKIASFLSVIDARIEVLSKQIEQSKVFKKGLLQQMFV